MHLFFKGFALFYVNIFQNIKIRIGFSLPQGFSCALLLPDPMLPCQQLFQLGSAVTMPVLFVGQVSER